MIYQLVKRDVSWKIAVGLALLAAFFGLWGPPGSLRLPGYWIFWTFMTVLFALSPAHKRCTAFEAALPIAGRDLLMARLVLSGISIWVPVLAAVLTILVSAGRSSGRLGWLLGLGAILSLAVIVIQSLHLQRFTAPPWWGAVIGILAVVALVLAPYEMPARFVVLICAAAGSILLWRCWLGVPASLQMARVDAARGHLGNVKLPFKLPGWTPAVRILFPKRSVAWFGVVLLSSMAAGNGSSVLFGLVWLFMFWLESVKALGSGWLLALPISRFRLFLAIGIAPLGLYMLSSFAVMVERGLPVRDMMVILMTVGVAGSLWLLNSAVPYVITGPITLLFMYSYIGLVFIDLHFGPPRSAHGIRTDALGAWLSTVLPSNVLLVVAIATVVIGLFLWLAYQVFRHIEPRRPLTSF